LGRCLTGRPKSNTIQAKIMEEKKEKVDTTQDWLIISIFFWIVFVLIVSLANIISPDYTPPLNPY
jgi:hypothetical protein